MKWRSASLERPRLATMPLSRARTQDIPGNTRKLLLFGAKEEGLQGSAYSASEASLLVHGGLYPIQELGNLSVDSWLLPTFLAPAYNPVDIVSSILLTG